MCELRLDDAFGIELAYVDTRATSSPSLNMHLHLSRKVSTSIGSLVVGLLAGHSSAVR